MTKIPIWTRLEWGQTRQQSIRTRVTHNTRYRLIERNTARVLANNLSNINRFASFTCRLTSLASNWAEYWCQVSEIELKLAQTQVHFSFQIFKHFVLTTDHRKALSLYGRQRVYRRKRAVIISSLAVAEQPSCCFCGNIIIMIETSI